MGGQFTDRADQRRSCLFASLTVIPLRVLENPKSHKMAGEVVEVVQKLREPSGSDRSMDATPSVICS